MDSIKNNPNLPLFITIGFTIALMIIGVVALSSTDKPKVTQEEIDQKLIREDSHIVGKKEFKDDEVKIEMVEFSDYECPACGSYFPEFEKVEAEYSNRVKFVFRNFPLRSIHPLAQKSAEAAEAASAQGKFNKYHDILYKNQREWSTLSEGDAISKFIDYAKEVGVPDTDKFEKELRDGTYKDRVDEDVKDGEDIGVDATPTVFLNGEKVTNPTYDNLSSKIQNLLDQSN